VVHRDGRVAVIRVRVSVLLACLIAMPQLADSAEFYVDPVHGDMSNDGSPGKPWRSIQAVFDQGLVESQQWVRLPSSRDIAGHRMF
jgi:hypothetical protein